jgi:tRNA nucleotidyltransferase (CCA-adding enzyme)
MKVYLVGGAVRDQLLGLPVKEKDWVVVGASVQEMLQQGFRQVGKDFPVFLHAKTNEEYALARRERKISRGYTGFDFDASPQVSLEDDLLRRDLTINAMAQAPDGVLIDPFHGKADLDKKMLRHVSPAFVEDPVRILRVARFAARYARLGFTVAAETILLMKTMVASGEVDALVAERVWKEFEKALSEDSPEQFIAVLAESGALAILFPGLHSEGQGVAALVQATSDSTDKEVRFSALLHDLSLPAIKDFCQRYKISSMFKELALLVAENYQVYLLVKKLSAEELLNLLQACDAFRREGRFEKFLISCRAIAVMRNQEDEQTSWLLRVYAVAKKIDISAFVNSGVVGHEIAKFVRIKRLEAINSLSQSMD